MTSSDDNDRTARDGRRSGSRAAPRPLARPPRLGTPVDVTASNTSRSQKCRARPSPPWTYDRPGPPALAASSSHHPLLNPPSNHRRAARRNPSLPAPRSEVRRGLRQFGNHHRTHRLGDPASAVVPTTVGPPRDHHHHVLDRCDVHLQLGLGTTGPNNHPVTTPQPEDQHIGQTGNRAEVRAGAAGTVSGSRLRHRSGPDPASPPTVIPAKAESTAQRPGVRCR